MEAAEEKRIGLAPASGHVAPKVEEEEAAAFGQVEVAPDEVATTAEFIINAMNMESYHPIESEFAKEVLGESDEPSEACRVQAAQRDDIVAPCVQSPRRRVL